MLTKQQQKLRENKVTASFAPALMAGDTAKINSEWRRLVGDPQWEEEDLRFVWPVQFGSYIETFALDWHARKTNMKLIRRGEVVTHPKLSHVSCTVDAFRPQTNTVIDCKGIGAYREIDDVIRYYTPQLVVQRACVDAAQTSLLVVHGGAEPVEYPVEYPTDYENEVFDRIDQFWKCVETLTPPFEMEQKLAPVTPIVEYDFSTDNEWCSFAGLWINNKAAAKDFEAAAKEIKSRIPADGVRAFGGGISVSRNKAGSLSIKEER